MLGKPKQLSQVCIEKGYIIDFEKMIQFKADDPEKYRQIFFTKEVGLKRSTRSERQDLVPFDIK
jgi:hypothetical protein